MTDVNLSKLHGPPLPMRFKIVNIMTGEIEPCVSAVEDLIFKEDDIYIFDPSMVFNLGNSIAIQSIGRRDRDNEEVYHGDVLEFDQAGFINASRACVRWDILGMNLRLVTRNGTTHPLSMCEQGRKIGNHFADKTLMEPKQEEQSNV